MRRLVVLLAILGGLLAQPAEAADRTVFVDGTTSGTPGTNGAHYASLSAAISGEVGAAPDLVSDSAILHIECSVFSGNAADTTAVNVDGFTTDSTHYIHIYTAAGSRHSGVWDATKYRLEVANPASNVLNIANDFVRVEGLQVRKTASDANDQMVVAVGGQDNTSTVYISDTIIRNVPGDAFRGAGIWVVDSDVTVYAWNNIVYGFPDTGGSAYGSAIMLELGTVYSYSNTLIGGDFGVVVSTGTTLNCKNSYIAATTTGQPSISNLGTFNNTTCAVDDTATEVGAGLRSIAIDTTTFTNVTASSEDFRLPGTGSPLYNVGTDGPDASPLDFTTDITGASRTSTWDIGADEVAGGGGGAAASPKLMLLGVGGE